MTDMTTRQYATALKTDPKTVRKFLRDTTPRDEHPGKGGRWVLTRTKRDLAKDYKQFLTWQKQQADAQAERAAKAAKDAQDAIDSDADEVEGDEDSEQGPDDSEITESED